MLTLQVLSWALHFWLLLMRVQSGQKCSVRPPQPLWPFWENFSQGLVYRTAGEWHWSPVYIWGVPDFPKQQWNQARDPSALPPSYKWLSREICATLEECAADHDRRKDRAKPEASPFLIWISKCNSSTHHKSNTCHVVSWETLTFQAGFAETQFEENRTRQTITRRMENERVGNWKECAW